jgi:hypothetical protein
MGVLKFVTMNTEKKMLHFLAPYLNGNTLREAFACLLEGLYTTVLPVEKLHSGIGIIGSQVK